MQKSVIEHPEYGRITVTFNPRARRIIMRVTHEGILVTMPPQATETSLQKALEKHGATLKKRRNEIKTENIDFNFKIETPNFSLRLQPAPIADFQLNHADGHYTIQCPPNCNFGSDSVQNRLHNIVGKALLHRGRSLLPSRLQQHAQRHGFSYKRVKIGSARTRWGSCSSNGTISLNCHLVLLPDELIDYVLLHELCHTREMNHGPRFWELMNSVTGAQAKLLRHRLKEYKILF